MLVEVQDVECHGSCATHDERSGIPEECSLVGGIDEIAAGQDAEVVGQIAQQRCAEQ